jgi:RNA polymerase sigma-70 factor (ECF subfamily)
VSVSTETNVARSVWQQELEKLFGEHYSMLYRTAYSLLGNTEDAEDVPQTIFLRLLKTDSVPDMQKNPAGYLYRAAVNASLSIIRKRKHESLACDSEHFESAIDRARTHSDEDAHRSVTELLAELSPEAAEILILRYVHDYSDADIAKMLGRSRGAIAVRLFRLRTRLKQFVQASRGERR